MIAARLFYRKRSGKSDQHDAMLMHGKSALAHQDIGVSLLFKNHRDFLDSI